MKVYGSVYKGDGRVPLLISLASSYADNNDVVVWGGNISICVQSGSVAVMSGEKTDPHLTCKRGIFWYLIHLLLFWYLDIDSYCLSVRHIFWSCPGVFQVSIGIGMLMLG